MKLKQAIVLPSRLLFYGYTVKEICMLGVIFFISFLEYVSIDRYDILLIAILFSGLLVRMPGMQFNIYSHIANAFNYYAFKNQEY